MANETIIHLTVDTFDHFITEGVTLVDFWASWCRPCKMLAPTIEQIASDYSGKIKVAKVNVDDQGTIAQQYDIMSIPTLILYKDGQPVDKIIGVVSKDQIVSVISRYADI